MRRGRERSEQFWSEWRTKASDLMDTLEAELKLARQQANPRASREVEARQGQLRDLGLVDRWGRSFAAMQAGFESYVDHPDPEAREAALRLILENIDLAPEEHRRRIEEAASEALREGFTDVARDAAERVRELEERIDSVRMAISQRERYLKAVSY
jgi:hypothetical protein